MPVGGPGAEASPGAPECWTPPPLELPGRDAGSGGSGSWFPPGGGPSEAPGDGGRGLAERTGRWQAPVPRRSRGGTVAIVVALFFAFLVLALTVAAHVATPARHLPAPPPPIPPANATPPPPAPAAPAPAARPVPAPAAAPARPAAPAAPAPAAGSLSTAAIAALVSPAVVDVNSALGLQGGSAAGTGMLLSSSGEVLTNNHVIAGASPGSISVQIAGTGRGYPATIVGQDPTDDVALLQLQGASGLRIVPLGDSSKAAVGAGVGALGNPLGRAGPPSASPGVIVALGQSIIASDPSAGTDENLTGLIQTSARLQPGDSGGPLVNGAGRVIGMDTAASARMRFDSAPSAGFAIPINRALSIAAEIRSGHAPWGAVVQPGFLGVVVTDVGGGPGAPGFVAPVGSGALVDGTVAGSPAEAAGLGDGAVLASLDGTPVRSGTGLTGLLHSRHAGDTVHLVWVDVVGGRHAADVRLVSRSGA